MTDKLEGKISGINLTNFLQIVQMEKPTVKLLIAKGNKEGALYIENGEIIDAETKSGLKHLEAAYEIISWDNSSIELKKTISDKKRIIKMPLMNILMEALRLKDEKKISPQEEEIDELEIKFEEESEILSKDFQAELPEDFSPDTLDESDEISFPDSEESFDELDSINFGQESFDPVSKDKSAQKNLEDHLETSQEKTDPQNQKNTLDNYDIGIELENESSLSEFTDQIVLPELKNKKQPKKIKKATPSIEDFIEKKFPWKKIIIGFLFALISISISVTGYIYINNKKIEKIYLSVLTDLDKMDYEDQKINLLKAFISTYPKSNPTEKAKIRLNTILKRTQKESFELMIQKINQTPVDDEYKERASRFYLNFLQRFPEGKYSEKTKELLNNIPEIIKNYEFEKLQAIPDSETEKKIFELENFKIKYPETKIEELTQIKNKAGNYYLTSIEIEVEKVDSLEKFEKVKKKIETFNKLFPMHPHKYKTSRLLRTLEEEKWAQVLLKYAKDSSASIEKEKEFLKNYIQNNNKYKIVNAANTRIREIDYILNEKQKFENLMTYSSNSNYSLENRINRLKAYIHSDTLPEYKKASEQKLNQLKKLDLSAQKSVEKTKTIQDKKITETKNINEMIKESFSKASFVRKKLADSSRFFIYGNFSFKDNLTGKTWLIIDSDDFSDKKCYFFKDAQEAVKQINIDGFSDWRLPSEQELLSLFKNKPFFPIEKNKWYWSKDVFEKGFNTYSAVITDNQSEQREKLNKDIFYDCGIFKAIRP